MSGTIVSAFLDRTTSDPDAVAFRRKVGGEWTPVTWGEYGSLVRRAFGGLRSLGLDTDDMAAILSGNRMEWHVADIATQSVGGVTVPIYSTNSPRQVAYITGHSESKAIFCENAAQLAKVLEVRHELPSLRKAVVFDADGVTSDDFVMTFDELLAAGEAFAGEFERYVAAVDLAHLCTLVYTSGTTGPPKGAMLSHENVIWTIDSLRQMVPGEPGVDRRLSYLPLSHIAERVVTDFSHVAQGFETWFAESLDTLKDDLQACRPTVFFAVPRVWEKFHAGIMALIESLDPETREKAEQGIQLGLKRVEARAAGTTLPPELEERYQEANAGLFALARGALGLDQAQALISGAAPINPEILRFFHAIGLPVAEVYGQTEDCGPTSLNPADKIKIGSVGPAIPGVEIKIAEDGEVLVKGGNVGLGYFKDSLATEQLIDAEGWMHSGDIGELDEDGYLRITDRKKDLIITAAGKNVAPQVIENMLKYSPWISQVVVVGDARPFLIALLTLDQEKVTAFADQKSIPYSDFPALVTHPDVQHLVENAVAEVNSNLARVEQIKKWHVFDREFAMEAEEVTPTLKIRRAAIMAKNADLVEEMYA